MRHHHRNRGFTLIELMITIAVIIGILLIAVPSFSSFRQRQAIRGAADQTLSLWQQARFEAAKRNEMVKFGVVESGDAFCIGLATTTDTDDETPCDCMTDGACDISRFPADQAEWRGVTLSGTPTMGGDTGVVVIDPKFTTLTEIDDAGALTLADPDGGPTYLVNMHVDRMGRGVLCESSSAEDHLSDYVDRVCDP
jgi:type IV fimbrial biogenesis protein FimT